MLHRVRWCVPPFEIRFGGVGDQRRSGFGRAVAFAHFIIAFGGLVSENGDEQLDHPAQRHLFFLFCVSLSLSLLSVVVMMVSVRPLSGGSTDDEIETARHAHDTHAPATRR